MEAIDWRRIAETQVWSEEWRKKVMNEISEAKEARKVQVLGDLYDDTVSIKGFSLVFFSPKFRHAAFLALRITLIVVFPLAYISKNYKDIFPSFPVLGLWGVVFSQETVGEQILFTVTTLQMAVWMSLWGSLINLSNAIAYPAAWWCAVFFGTFTVALFGDVRCRRIAIMFTALVMEFERAMPQRGVILPLLVSRDMMLPVAFGLAQSLLPPFTMTNRADETLRKGWMHVSHMVQHASKNLWSQDPIETVLELSKLNTEPLQDLFSNIPAQLAIVAYEPWESTLRLELRKERVQVLQSLMPMIHALVGVARVLTFLPHSQTNQKVNEEDKDDEKNSSMPAIADMTRTQLQEALRVFLDALDATLQGLGTALNPEDVVAKVPFDELQLATSQLQSAIDKMHFRTLVSRKDSVDSVRYIHSVFAHLMLVLLSEELLKYAELMRNFDRKRYKSTSRSMLNFFFLDYWNDFWIELPKRITLATPRDVRLVKDAFKLACAYTVACAYTQYIDADHIYFFGMAILMGVGLPTAGESLLSGVQRVAGLVFAASIAYLADMHHKTDAQQYAIVLVGVFIALFARVFTAYQNCAFYCAMIIPSAMHLVVTPLTLLSRLVSNSFTVMTYYAIVVFVFPVDPIKILHNTEVECMKAISDSFSDLMDLVQAPIGGNDTGVLENLQDVQKRRTPMWASVRRVPVQIRTAAGEPTIRGLPFPTHMHEELAPVLRRLASSVDIILIGMLSIHRHRVEPVPTGLLQILLSIRPLVQSIHCYSLYVMQDFVNALMVPKQWSYDESATHFSVLLQLNNELREAFTITHRNFFAAVREKAVQLRGDSSKSQYSFVASAGVMFPVQESQMSRPPYGNGSGSEEPEEVEMECEELAAPRNASFMLRPDEFTINHDINMSIAILVGIDLFCSQVEKTLRIMFHLNAFESGRQTREKG